MLLICFYLYTQPNNRTHRSSYYKVPLQLLESEKLLKYIVWDYKIELELEISLRFFLIYKLTKTKLVALKEFI